MEETTLLLKLALSVTTMRPMVSAFKCFHTSSSGLRSGEYGGRKNSFSRPPSVSTNALVFLARCAGPRSTIRKIVRVSPTSSRLRNSIKTSAFTPPVDHEPHAPFRGDRRNQAHSMTGTGGRDDRGLALLAPGAPRVMIGADMSRITKIDVG